MKVLLYDVDSVIPNIALMKISTYHKNMGNEVMFLKGNGKFIDINYDDYDKGYASVIFTKNKELVKDFPWNVGGTGFDIEKKLPDNVEHLMPDYSLYPDNEYSIGFLTRGCIRKCQFCFVPKKEGQIRFNAHVDEFMNPNFKKIRILDNNILGYEKWEQSLIELKSTNKRIKFENFDFRLLTEHQAKIILEIKIDGDYIFALDHPSDMKYFESKMWILKKHFSPWRCKFYVLVGYDTTLKDDINRVKFLLSHQTLPYIMRHEKCYSSIYKDFYTDLAAWCNQVAFVKKMSFEDFLQKRHTKQERINFSLNLWNKNQ